MVTFRTYNPELNLSCHELLVVFGLSTLNSSHTYHKLRITNWRIKNANICPCDSQFEHRIAHVFADALYGRFSLHVACLVIGLVKAKQEHHSKLRLNYDKQFNKGGQL